MRSLALLLVAMVLGAAYGLGVYLARLLVVINDMGGM